MWGEAQEHSTLHISPCSRETIIVADAPATGVGAVLTHVQEDDSRRPIFYASRSLSVRCDKRGLATTWACEQFSEYVTGLQFTVETKCLATMPSPMKSAPR